MVWLLVATITLLAGQDAIALRPGQDGVDEQIEEYRRFYKKGLSLHERVEAIHVLEECDRREAAELLLDAARDKEAPVRAAAVEVLGGFSSGEVRDLLVEVAADRGATKSGRRSAAIQALGHIANGGVDVLIENLSDRDFEVRRASVVALGQMRALQAIDALIVLLEDKEPALRTAALEALGDMKAPGLAAPAVIGMLEADQWQVRASAIGALGKLRAKESIGPLIDVMRREEGRLREDALNALKAITGNQYHEDPDLWQRWWDNVKDRYQVPSEAELERLRKVQEENSAKYKDASTDFVGLQSKSRRIVFVIDVSGSMEELIQDRKNFKLADRAYRSYQKMEIVKEELARTIEGLEGYVKFNVVSFATKIDPWKKTLVPANIVNKNGAMKWVRSLKPIGGASQGFRARAGIGGGTSEGRTNTYEALMAALEAGGRGGFDKHYKSAVDTIFFLSDGVPTVGKFTDDEEILAEVRRVNSLRKIVIHTIAIGDMQRNLMKQLARENGGIFVDLGK